jgi:hypothetical protein
MLLVRYLQQSYGTIFLHRPIFYFKSRLTNCSRILVISVSRQELLLDDAASGEMKNQTKASYLAVAADSKAVKHAEHRREAVVLKWEGVFLNPITF